MEFNQNVCDGPKKYGTKDQTHRAGGQPNTGPHTAPLDYFSRIN